MCWCLRRLRRLLVASRNEIRFTTQIVRASRHYSPGRALTRSSHTVRPAWNRAREQALGPAMKVASRSFRGWGNPRRLCGSSRSNHNDVDTVPMLGYFWGTLRQLSDPPATSSRFGGFHPKSERTRAQLKASEARGQSGRPHDERPPPVTSSHTRCRRRRRPQLTTISPGYMSSCASSRAVEP